MPELPEVETICSALAKRVVGLFIKQVVLRTAKLRQCLPPLDDLLPNSQICAVARRAKYLLITLDRGTLIIHFGMSGRLRLMPDYYAPTKHDHIDWILSNRTVLRFNDPRRFGDVVWSEQDPFHHPCLAKLGPEPLSSTAHAADYLSCPA
ncbi:MAG: hypothetical protein IPK86_01955 [Neisseriales bacterium]|nr:MAG: hypothetical protein IPK86_01955 [Neisseriales bacterium]